MDQNISRTEAHKIFANLYRKQRTAEHQAQVDEIITRSNDVFIRIDLIKKLDEEFEKKEKLKQREARDDKKPSNPTLDSIPETKGVDIKLQTAAKIAAQKESGLFGRLFGTNQNLSKFAKESRALDMGLLGRNPTISPNVQRVFKFLKEEEIIATAQSLKYAEQVGWKIWKPLDYNIIANFGRFFNSFISLDSLFRDDLSPEIFLTRSTKMQMYYIRVLQYQRTKEIVMEKVPALVKLEPKLGQKIEQLMRGLSYSLTLESRRPTLKDIIIAFHVIQTKKLVEWQEIVDKLGVGPLDENKYAGPPEVVKQIELSVARIGGDIQTKLGMIEELEMIKRNYFTFQADGNVSQNFVNVIIDEHIKHHYQDNPQAETVRANIPQNAPKLLYVLCRDLQTVYLPLFEGYIKVDSENIKDVLLFQNGLFFPEIDKLNSIIRSLDMFNKKFPSFIYPLSKFFEDQAKGTGDQIEQQLVKLIADSADFFGKFAKKLTVVVENDSLAKNYEDAGNINERTVANKDKTIEEIKIMQRFIPYRSAKLVTGNRIHGRTVRESIFELTKYLYNFAYLFHDPAISSILMNYKKYDTDLAKLNAEYERLTGKSFVPGGHLH